MKIRFLIFALAVALGLTACDVVSDQPVTLPSNEETPIAHETEVTVDEEIQASPWVQEEGVVSDQPVNLPLNEENYPIAHETEMKLDEDIQVSSWAREEVERAVVQGVCPSRIVDLPPDLSEPTTRGGCCDLAAWFVAATQNCDESDFVHAVLYNNIKVEPGRYGGWSAVEPSQFTDVYSVGYLDALYHLGVVKGKDNGTFGSRDTLTRQEAAVFLARAYEVCGGELPQTADLTAFADQDEIAPWARESVASLTAAGFFKGDQAGRFDPNGVFSSEQCIVVLGRMYEELKTPKQLLTYEQYMAELENTWWPIVERVEGPVAIFIKQKDPVANSIPVVNYSCKLVYRDGGVRSLTDFAVCDSGRGFLDSFEQYPPQDVHFSRDGKTLYCTLELSRDVTETSYGRHTHEAGVYEVAIDVETRAARAAKTE